VTRAEIKRLRRTWRRGGLPGFGTTPPLAPVPAPRTAAEEAAAERLLDTAELAVIWDGWKGGRR
jgi:hypothetical protein